jgi:peptidoglycan/LPS O-acetylase OafA/YrhL
VVGARPTGGDRLRATPSRLAALFALPCVAVAVVTVVFYGAHRIRSSMEPVVVVLAAVALVAIWDGVTRRAWTCGVSDRTLRYQPALDGVRALAVTTVLMFHHGVAWMSGGYVGVSVFFTLSGYLITSLLVAEHRERNTISLGRFYARRARRLLPAGLLCLALVVIARRAGEFELVPNLRRDLLGSLFQVQNWVKLLGPASYTELLNTTTASSARSSTTGRSRSRSSSTGSGRSRFSAGSRSCVRGAAGGSR